MAKLPRSSNTSPLPEDLRERGDAIRNSLNLVLEFFSEEVLIALHTAAADDAIWKKALRDPQDFFASNRIEIPHGVFIRFLEAPNPEPGDAIPISGPQYAQPQQPPPIQCPPGLFPTPIMVAYPQRCTKLVEWHVDFSPVGGNPDAHGWFCVDYETIVEQRWVCSVHATATKV